MDKYPIENDWVGDYDNAPSCFYNSKVGCGFPHCETCGWNPFVSLERITIKYGTDAVNYLTMND